MGSRPDSSLAPGMCPLFSSSLTERWNRGICASLTSPDSIDAVSSKVNLGSRASKRDNGISTFTYLNSFNCCLLLSTKCLQNGTSSRNHHGVIPNVPGKGQRKGSLAHNVQPSGTATCGILSLVEPKQKDLVLFSVIFRRRAMVSHDLKWMLVIRR